jgi:hypothetical protein
MRQQQQQAPPVSAGSSIFHRGNSMDVLARVSAEIHDEEVMEDDEEDEHEDEEDDEDEEGGRRKSGSGTAGTNYRKLPPGVTPKKNQRLFVKHQYRDHSGEQPRQNELDLASKEAEAAADRSPSPSSPAKRSTASKTFPVMLHQTLTQIEDDGFGNIVGWMPHGRSFRIFRQEEFVDIVLPRYFVMTKARCLYRINADWRDSFVAPAHTILAPPHPPLNHDRKPRSFAS